MPWWLKTLSAIPIVSSCLTRKVKMQVLCRNDKGEPVVGLNGKVRIPRAGISPIKISFSFPEDVPANMMVFIKNSRDENIYVRDLKTSPVESNKEKLFAMMATGTDGKQKETPYVPAYTKLECDINARLDATA